MKKFIVILVLVLLTLGGIILYNNQFDMKIETEQVKTRTGSLAVEYAMPKKQSDKPGLVLFVHGDGPANKNSDTGYYPAWETLAQENYISISWDKAGVGESTGNWLKQDMTDRAKEVDEVLEWALANLDIDPEKVGVWGASQGGWVISKVLNQNEDVKFAIGVAPAVNWMRQGRYNAIADMTDQGVSQEDIDKELNRQDKVNAFLETNGYDSYLASHLDEDPLAKDRWDFIYKNMSLDNSDELKEIRKPYYLIIGDHDINVDTEETERIYQDLIPEQYLTVFNIKNATHRMVKPRHQRDNLLTVVESIFNPREIFAPEYFKALKECVR
ncbi:prolyl oligopeptidase family serine peptidase [Vagococcus coleopterorum]|uniref:Prolyl oligopeptidase family serine peptidase n=1 Tax=Vagococcus coleopterorum TaxID=2714946 RepID=A0A6G8APH2_9ENTE|nr:prolyl oligopeptidase family serine peptidase [Vagococcus coleopterorum]QIL46842.1 prolyl oligopeptidase family serine peptidase [Vagococcus coleopterorum]